jgi:DNA-binding NtrC family response regulator
MGKLWEKGQKLIGKNADNEIRNPDAPILFVDDDPIIHRVVEKYLKHWNVTSVYSANEALEALENKNFVIVITDLRMPGMDGIELLHEIRARYSNRVQVIVITVSDDLEDLVSALDGGASDFLLKPLKKEVLEEVLEHTLLRIDRWNQTLNLLVSKKNPA